MFTSHTAESISCLYPIPIAKSELVLCYLEMEGFSLGYFGSKKDGLVLYSMECDPGCISSYRPVELKDCLKISVESCEAFITYLGKKMFRMKRSSVTYMQALNSLAKAKRDLVELNNMKREEKDKYERGRSKRA